jgi:hypothetical protein
MGTPPTGPTQPGVPAPPPPAYGAPPPAAPPPGTPPYGAPPYPAARRSGPLVAVVVIVVVVVAAAAALFFFLSSREDTTTETTTPVSPVAPPSPVTPSVAPASPVTPTEPTSDVTLDDLLLPGVGPFQLQGVSADPDSVATFGATDALVADYRRSDGVQIVHNLLGFAAQPDASVARRVFVQTLKGGFGYVEVDQFRRGSLNATLLVGPDEVLVWTNGPLMAVVEGPFGLTVPFFQALPY